MAATLLNLRTWARSRADMTGSTFRSDTEVTRCVNAAYAKLYRGLLKVYADYFSATTNITLISGTDTYSLAAVNPAVRKLRGVDLVLSANAGDFITLGSYAWAEREKLALGSAVGSRIRGDFALRYCLMGSSLIFAPIPRITNTVRLRYVPELTVLAVDGDTIAAEIKEGWEDFIVLDAAITLLRDEESDTRDMQGDRDALWRDIEEDAGTRDAEAPEKMARLRSSGDEEDWS